MSYLTPGLDMCLQVHRLMIFHMRTSSLQNENTFMSSMEPCNDYLADAMCRQIILVIIDKCR
jgi:pyrimidine deaminase RibD-like protein